MPSKKPFKFAAIKTNGSANYLFPSEIDAMKVELGLVVYKHGEHYYLCNRVATNSEFEAMTGENLSCTKYLV